jgi:L-alanine-DL-glutamate epimerase-like enolase superfamily enzyme
MKITRARITPVSIPWAPPIGLGAFDMVSSGCVLTQLETDAGLVGEGLVFSINGKHLEAIEALTRELAELAVGLAPEMSGRFTAASTAAVGHIGQMGLSAVARAGVEMALLDLRAKAVELNVAQLLGCYRTTMPVYQSGELWVSLSTDALARAAGDQAEKGFRAIKVRLVGDPARDIDRVRAVREAVGPDIGIFTDANQKMSVDKAIRLGRELEQLGVAWFEEPVSVSNPRGELAVAEALGIPVALGESVYTARGIHELLKQGAASIVMPDLQRMGGPGEFLKAAALAEAFGVPMSSHLFPEMSLALLAAIPNAQILEYMPWASPLYAEQIELDERGEAVLPDRPGWGFSFDPKAIARFAL